MSVSKWERNCTRGKTQGTDNERKGSHATAQLLLHPQPPVLRLSGWEGVAINYVLRKPSLMSINKVFDELKEHSHERALSTFLQHDDGQDGTNILFP